MDGVALGVAAEAVRGVQAGLERSSPQNGFTVAVIGGGVSGALTSVHLARQASPGVRLVLFDKSGQRARGLAYSTGEPAHLLNVRAANMSAFPDKPDHFERWLALRREPVTQQRTDAGVFVSREVYGTYLENILMKACGEAAPDPLDKLRGPPIAFRGEAVRRVSQDEQGFTLHLASGEAMHADAVVLAMGNITRACDESGPLFSNPWAPEATTSLDPGRPVLIQGTALTMIDTLRALRQNGFSGKVIAVSRRGLLPHVHIPAKPRPAMDFKPHDVAGLSALMRRIRREIAIAAAEGDDWRAVIDGLRPITQALWRSLPVEEKARFLRHARPWWDVRRHRIPAGVAAQIAHERESGILEIVAGRISATQAGRDDVTVIYRPRGESQDIWVDVQRVIQATGVPNLRDAQDGLVAGLIEIGAAQLDPLGLGLDVTEDFRVCGAGGYPVPGLWALGPIVRGAFWECVAVPDIRLQAVRLADRIAAEINQRAARPELTAAWMPGL